MTVGGISNIVGECSVLHAASGLASDVIYIMAEHRTTVVAREEDLATLSHEARARELSLGRMLGEVLAERAEDLRRARRPPLATFRADMSIAKTAGEERLEARPFRPA
jgi:hypothetical protein